MTAPQIIPQFVRLVPTNLDNPHECTILRAQRVICGWKIDIAQKVRKQMAEGQRILYWITLSPDQQAFAAYGVSNAEDLPRIRRNARGKDGEQKNGVEEAEKKGEEAEFVPIGHISLDKRDFPEAEGDVEPDVGLVSEDGSVLTITTLFVLPEFRKHGIATWAMLSLETQAKNAGATAVTINTLSDRHFDANDPEMVAIWKSIGRTMPVGSTIGWYENMGYKKYRGDLERYRNKTIDEGKEIWFSATFMRKEL